MTTQYRRFVLQIADQRKWIEGCEANGVSYADGERGQRIREADTNELRRLELALSLLPPSHRH